MSEDKMNALMSINLNQFVVFDQFEADNGKDTKPNDDENDTDPISSAFTELMNDLNLEDDEKDSSEPLIKLRDYSFEYRHKSMHLSNRVNSLKPLALLCKKPPSPKITYHIIYTLYLFLFHYRIFNGEVLNSFPVYNFDTKSISAQIYDIKSALN